MWCPRCRAEYVPGFDRCSDCGVPLVEEEPPNPEDVLLARLRQIDVAYRCTPLRDRFRRRARFDVADTWAIAKAQPGRWLVPMPWESTANTVVRIARTVMYLAIGAPANRVAKARRLRRVRDRRPRRR